MNRLNKTESAVFLYCRISISEVSVFLIIKRSQQLSFSHVDLVKFLSVYRCIDIVLIFYFIFWSFGNIGFLRQAKAQLNLVL